MSLTFKSFGARGITCQVNRIDNGFKELGLIESDKPDFIYSNDARTNYEALNYKLNFAPKAKLILNILDVPIHLPSCNLQEITNTLRSADAITSISQYTKDCVLQNCGFDSTIIYQPINNIYKTEGNPNFKTKLLILGRFRDPNKRTKLALDAFEILGYNLNRDVIAVGPDTGVIVSEEQLNHFYNGAEYVCCVSFREGLLLPCLEAVAAVAAGCIPLICGDLTTYEELFPRSLFPEYAEIGANSLDLVRFIGYMEGDSDTKEKFKERLYKHYKDNLEEKFKSISVAKKIVGVYESIK
jgi:hypothetical protein